MARIVSGRIRRCAPHALAALALVASLVAADARAAATEEREAPRVAVSVGPVGVVLIAANRQLYAFLDRLGDNAPVAGGQVTVKGPKIDLTLTETAPGLYRAGPFLPAIGHTPLTVSVQSALGAGQTAAELVVTPPPAPAHSEGRSRPLWLALGAAALAGVAGLAWRGRRRRSAPSAIAGAV
ncbi:hypothetical protein [Azospirillum agricola]|uniref:hypothetical protein n=1 Tax=Azospirillum agricola TaxID=1720247 RepID=UPI000A0F11E8|nr:hypothetical protein [Azospirillum agricola]SMH60520.1 hypothetical protein SAMN02982994_5553 [Azospirillum lipoferum]